LKSPAGVLKCKRQGAVILFVVWQWRLVWSGFG